MLILEIVSVRNSFLGINFEYKLTFDSHISGLCKKASKNVSCASKSNTIYEHLETMYYYEIFFEITIQ